MTEKGDEKKYRLDEIREEYKPKSPEEFDFKDIIYEKKDGVARVIIDRPGVYNSYSLMTLKEMNAAFHDASWDDSIGVIVFGGTGDRAFCTGGDVKEYGELYTAKPRLFWKWFEYYNRAHDAIRTCGKPVIARVNGMVVGGGNEFHMSCDLSIAAEHATFRQVGTRMGSVAAGGATQYLPLMIGDRRARWMLYTCEPIDAKTALEWGLINQVVPYDKLDEAVDELAKKLLDKFPECTRYTKQQVNFWKDLVWGLTIGHARDWLGVHMSSYEALEGMWAFIEKRPWDYKKFRQLAAEDKSSEFPWGPYVRTCSKCGAKNMPESFKHCGVCGTPID